MIRNAQLAMLALLLVTATSAAEVPSNTLMQHSTADEGQLEAHPTANRPPTQSVISAPRGAENIYFTLQDVEIENELDSLKDATYSIIEPNLSQRISVKTLYEIASNIQQAYFNAGYPLVRVIIPQQNISNEHGIVRFTVVYGFIEEIDLTNLPPQLTTPVKRILGPLINKKYITNEELTRRVLLAGDVAGLQLTSALAPGKKKGGVILLMQGEYTPITSNISFDNALSKEAGDSQLIISVNEHSLSHLGEVISLTYAGIPKKNFFTRNSPRRYAELNIAVPIHNNGLQFIIDATKSTANAIGQATPLHVHSEYDRAMLRLVYPAIRERSFNLYTWTNLEFIAQQQSILAVSPKAIIGNDRLRVLRFGIDASKFDATGGLIRTALHLSKGLDLGARKQSEATISNPLSRLNASPIFTAVQLSIDYTKPTYNYFEGFIKIKGQSSFGKSLLTSEQFTIGGPDQLSTFHQGEIYGDAGGFTRIELRLRHKFNLQNIASTIKPYTFIAAGKTGLKYPSAAENKYTKASSYGLGMRINFINSLEAFTEFSKGRMTKKPKQQKFLLGFSFNL